MEKTVCPHCERKLRNINAWHYCQKIEIDELFVDKSDEIVLVFDTIMQQVSQWENVEAEPPGFVVLSRYREAPHPQVSFQRNFATRLEPQPEGPRQTPAPASQVRPGPQSESLAHCTQRLPMQGTSGERRSPAMCQRMGRRVSVTVSGGGSATE